jgi:hypothetical protein
MCPHASVIREHGLKQLLEMHMAKATTLNVKEGPLATAISRLALEADFLIKTCHHDWIKHRTKELGDFGNWAAYAMETHITYAFERAGMHVTNGVGCMLGSKTDVDIVLPHSNGIEIRIECVSLREPSKFWTNLTEIMPGIELKSASHDINGEADCLRVIQDKIRLKTINVNGSPIKFPMPDSQVVHIIAADVSNAAGWDPDWWDLQEIALGSESALAFWRHKIVGLFESGNRWGSAFDAEFERNRYVRERVHAIFFFIDESGFHHPLNAQYCGHCVINPNLAFSQEQETAVDAILRPLHTLVTRGWLKQPRIIRK